MEVSDLSIAESRGSHTPGCSDIWMNLPQKGDIPCVHIVVPVDQLDVCCDRMSNQVSSVVRSRAGQGGPAEKDVFAADPRCLGREKCIGRKARPRSLP